MSVPASITDAVDRARDHQRQWKQAVVNDFLLGISVQQIADRCCCKRLTVESALRQAITGLVQQIAQPNDAEPSVKES